MFTGFQVGDDFLSYLREVTPFDEVVRFQEYSTQTRLPNRIILEIEFIKTMERVCMGLNDVSFDTLIDCRVW